jgi:hypothetical protein
MQTELTADIAGRTVKAAMLSEEVYLGQFGKDRLAAMSQEQLEQALAWAKERLIEFEKAEKERRRRDEEEGCYTHISVFDRMCYWDVTVYEIELELRKRRALNEDRLTLLKELTKVRRERDYDRRKFPDRREIVIEELLGENGGNSLAFRRYSRGVEPWPSKARLAKEEKELREWLDSMRSKLDETAEHLLRDKPHSSRTEEPRDD